MDCITVAGSESVLDEVDIWKSATIELMFDEEDGFVDGVSGWIVRPPPSRSLELDELYITLRDITAALYIVVCLTIKLFL